MTRDAHFWCLSGISFPPCDRFGNNSVTTTKRCEKVLGGFFLACLVGMTHARTAYADGRAIIIAASNYPYLQNRNLEGPANDAVLMSRTLNRLGLNYADITLLAESTSARALPTRRNILASLDRASRQGQPGEWLIVYFSGHGSQVPQAKPRNGHTEPEGLDEIFLPRDTRRWLPEKNLVEGALLDDDIGVALDRIRARGINVWAIFDTCHAGDMAKGGFSFEPDAPVYRYVSPFSLGIPTELFARTSRRDATRTRIAMAQKVPATTRQHSVGQLITFYASRSDEPAAEELLPDPSTPVQRLRYGVFTYALHQQTEKWNGSFRELANRLRGFYKDRPFPTPQFEGVLETDVRFPSKAQQPDKPARAASVSLP